jgi:hypothetical protein
MDLEGTGDLGKRVLQTLAKSVELWTMLGRGVCSGLYLCLVDVEGK